MLRQSPKTHSVSADSSVLKWGLPIDDIGKCNCLLGDRMGSVASTAKSLDYKPLDKFRKETPRTYGGPDRRQKFKNGLRVRK